MSPICIKRISTIHYNSPKPACQILLKKKSCIFFSQCSKKMKILLKLFKKNGNKLLISLSNKQRKYYNETGQILDCFYGTACGTRFYHGRQSRISQCKPGGNRAKQVGSAVGLSTAKKRSRAGLAPAGCGGLISIIETDDAFRLIPALGQAGAPA